MNKSLEHLEALVDYLVNRISKLEEIANNKQLLAEIENLKLCLSELLSRVNILEDTNKEVPRFIQCPFCGEHNTSKVTVVIIKYNSVDWFAGQCSLCKATGPQVVRESEALWAWNQFVSHRGKVNSREKDEPYTVKL